MALRDRKSRGCWVNISIIIICDHPLLVLLPPLNKLLSILHHIRLFMTINIHALLLLTITPLQIPEPMLSSLNQDWSLFCVQLCLDFWYHNIRYLWIQLQIFLACLHLYWILVPIEFATISEASHHVYKSSGSRYKFSTPTIALIQLWKITSNFRSQPLTASCALTLQRVGKFLKFKPFNAELVADSGVISVGPCGLCPCQSSASNSWTCFWCSSVIPVSAKFLIESVMFELDFFSNSMLSSSHRCSKGSWTL